MGPSTTLEKYILLICDDFSSYVWLYDTTSATSSAAADALFLWIGTFEIMTWLVTDQGSHFLNDLSHYLTEKFHIQHHLATPYSPWANGSVERIYREVLRASRALLFEYRLPQTHWPSISESVQSIFNHAPLRRMGLRSKDTPNVYRTPQEINTNTRSNIPLIHPLPIDNYKNRKQMDTVNDLKVISIDDIQNSLKSIHREMSEKSLRLDVELSPLRTKIQI